MGSGTVRAPGRSPHSFPIPERQDGDTVGDIIRIILLVVIPPIGVLFTVGFGLQFILNVLLTLFGGCFNLLLFAIYP